MAEQAPALVPLPKPGARFLVVNGPVALVGPWSTMFVLALRYGQRDIQAQGRRWDPQKEQLQLNPQEYDYALLYDAGSRRYMKLTPGVLPSRVKMPDAAAGLSIVSGVGPVADGIHRWAFQQPEFRFSAPPSKSQLVALSTRCGISCRSDSGFSACGRLLPRTKTSAK